ncbi:HSPB1-associated protein 1-like [Symbiodinium microadriaticum]|uniref:HSPB1-associated protein 1-like n=1 Tax=Symbiodinium microadriaticum TaxID=2951 RepID=A0A1Q9CNE5_SYMMI|nr:HSPB1-associated protein 1-like [Symbiodinium microadriaticum]CAE7512435.1 hspbap1 [Symbiodinium microadriaticum]
MDNLLATPLEQTEIDELLSLFPDFTGTVPEEARFWKKSDLELFIASNGQLKPKENEAAKSKSCPLLSRARQRLAELKIGEASAEYLSWTRHRQRTLQQLPGLERPCTPVQTAAQAPAVPKVPVVVSAKSWCGSSWDMDFWKALGHNMWWTCRSRSPAFEHDRKAADRVDVEASPPEYIEYARLLHSMDPDCLEDNALAFPRIVMDGWCPFISTEGSALLAKHWRELTPAGVKDMSPKWIKIFTTVFTMDFMDFFARFYKLALGAPGSISRLHRSNNGAHVWHRQIQGRRLFFLFPPQDTANLSEEEGAAVDHLEGYAASVSSVDIFYPSGKRHAAFAKASAQSVVLHPGESLIIPNGWWHYAVHLEPSVTLHHPFWGIQNRSHFSEELREAFIASKMPPELREVAARNISQIHERIMEDDDDDSDYEV